MSKKLKRPIAFIASLAMVCSMLLYLPGGVMTDLLGEAPIDAQQR